MSNETKKYAGLEALQTFLDGCKTLFATITHKHTLSDITDYVVDSSLSSTSTNPIQNKVINAEFDAVSEAMGALEAAIDEKLDTSTASSTYETKEDATTKLNEAKSYTDIEIDKLSDTVAFIDSTDNESVSDANNTLTTAHIVDGLNSSSSSMVLSAKQGKVLNERINTLEDGSTTGDAELEDARIDKDGNTHDNVGEHIRNVTSQLSSEIVDLKNNGTGGGTVVAGVIDYDLNVKAVNHRGYCRVAPENTIPAFILSKQNGFKYVECDVRFTSDGVAVLLHNSSIDNTSDGSGEISSLTYNEVLQYDFGSWKSADYTGVKIPTFEEFIVFCKNVGLYPYIELKAGTDAQIKSLVDTVKSCGMSGKVTWISFGSGNLTHVKNYDSKARLGLLCDITSTTVAENAVTTVQSLQTSENEVFVDSALTVLNNEKIQYFINANIPLEAYETTSYTTDRILAMHPYITGVTTDGEIAGKILYEANMTYTKPDEPENPEATLTSISASYTGGDVVIGTSVNSLTGITVTGTYSDGSTANIKNYTLSGTIAEGSNTITVSYGGKTTTFTVTGVAESGGDEPDEPSTGALLYNWDFTKSLTDTVSGVTATLGGGASQDTNGLHLNSATDYCYLTQILNEQTQSRMVEVDIVSSEPNLGSSHGRLIMFNSDNTSNMNNGFVYRNTGAWNTYFGGWETDTTYTNANAFDGKTLKVEALARASTIEDINVYENETLILSDTYSYTDLRHLQIGSSSNSFNKVVISAVRVYEI